MVTSGFLSVVFGIAGTFIMLGLVSILIGLAGGGTSRRLKKHSDLLDVNLDLDHL